MSFNFFKKGKNKEDTDKYGIIDMNNANDYLLNDVLHNKMETKDVVQGDSLYCPKWDVTITPKVTQLTGQSAMLEINVYSPKWGTELYECSVGMGSDTKQAIGMASGSFLFSFMNSIAAMEQNQNPKPLETEFAGKTHKWQVFFGNVVGMGESPTKDSAETYWEALKDGIIKRLGNQKLCYVKVYGAKTGGEITGECRIDDIKSNELSEIVAKIVQKWEVNQFASIKTFFFIRQEKETVSPCPYRGKEGFEVLKEKVKTAALMFYSCNTDEEYDYLSEKVSTAINDPVLAAECYSFLPEICAENAFPEASYSEALDIQFRDKPLITCYKNQLSDYWLLHKALFSLFNSGAFGGDTDEIYAKYIGYSATYHGIAQLLDKGGKAEDAKFTNLIYNVGDDFKIR